MGEPLWSWEDDRGIASKLVFWVFLVAGLVGILSAAALVLKPTWLGFERGIFTASHQYIEGRVDEIQILTTEYNSLNAREIGLRNSGHAEQAGAVSIQMSAIRDRIIHTAEDLPNDEVPESAQRIINRN